MPPGAANANRGQVHSGCGRCTTIKPDIPPLLSAARAMVALSLCLACSTHCARPIQSHINTPPLPAVRSDCLTSGGTAGAIVGVSTAGLRMMQGGEAWSSHHCSAKESRREPTGLLKGIASLLQLPEADGASAPPSRCSRGPSHPPRWRLCTVTLESAGRGLIERGVATAAPADNG